MAVLGLAIGGVGYLALRVLGAPGPRPAPGWQLLAEMPSPRGETAGASTGTRLIVIGGLSGLDSAASDQVSTAVAVGKSTKRNPQKRVEERERQPLQEANSSITDSEFSFDRSNEEAQYLTINK